MSVVPRETATVKLLKGATVELSSYSVIDIASGHCKPVSGTFHLHRVVQPCDGVYSDHQRK